MLQATMIALTLVIVDEARRQLPREAANLVGRPRAVRVASRVADVDEVLGGEQIDDGAGDGEPAEPGVEHPDRPIHGQQARSRRSSTCERRSAITAAGRIAATTSVEITAPPNRKAKTYPPVLLATWTMIGARMLPDR